jgi:thymidylate kinase
VSKYWPGRQSVIIFDSPDGTGKTNIAAALAGMLEIPYFKVNSEHQHWRDGKFKTALEFDQYLIQLLEQTGQSIIIDRAWPAEWVYSKVYDRETNDELLEELDDRFAKIGTNIIIPVRMDYSVARKDELVEKDMLPKLHDKYLQFSGWSHCRTIVLYVDCYDDDLRQEMAAIVPNLDFFPEVPGAHIKLRGKE